MGKPPRNKDRQETKLQVAPEENSAFELYSCVFALEDMRRFGIWFRHDNGRDGFLVTPKGKVALFENLKALEKAAAKNKFVLQPDEAAVFDLDEMRKYVPRIQSGEELDCSRVLDCWNILIDVACSVPNQSEIFLRERKMQFAIREKLFLGCNLPKITPQGEEYRPHWSQSELQAIHHSIALGITVFRRVFESVDELSLLEFPSET